MNWKIIRTEEEYQTALGRLDEIFDCNKEDVHFDEAELLVMLIEKYEMETEPAFKNPDPIEVSISYFSISITKSSASSK